MRTPSRRWLTTPSRNLVAMVLLWVSTGLHAAPRPVSDPPPPPLHSNRLPNRLIRGVTIGPIESAAHPGVGYGTATCGQSLDQAQQLGAEWVAITPFGRVWSTRTSAVDMSFEVPFADNREAVGRTIDQAHARGLSVFLVPHLWLERGDWRGEIEPGAEPDIKRPDGGYDFQARATPAAIRAFARAYRRFAVAWADVAERHHAEMFSLGVELRSWITSARALNEISDLVTEVRRHYHGLLTYSANWDDVDDALVWRNVDFVGLNAFYPLAEHDGAGPDELTEGGRRVRAKVAKLARDWGRPVLFTELGYTARPNPAVRPWEWPDKFSKVVVDVEAQADAYRAILAGLVDEPSFAGFFVWRQFADPEDVSQEPPWGFPFTHRPAERLVRDAFATRWGYEAPSPPWTVLGRGAHGDGLYWQFPPSNPMGLAVVAR